jgi:mRNA interferase MazF
MHNVTIAPLTRTDRNLPTEVRLTPADGLPTNCVVSLDNILTVRLATLDRVITQLSTARMREVYAAIREALQMPN